MIQYAHSALAYCVARDLLICGQWLYVHITLLADEYEMKSVVSQNIERFKKIQVGKSIKQLFNLKLSQFAFSANTIELLVGYHLL